VKAEAEQQERGKELDHEPETATPRRKVEEGCAYAGPAELDAKSLMP